MNAIIKCETYRFRISKIFRLMMITLFGGAILGTAAIVLFNHLVLPDEPVVLETQSFFGTFTKLLSIFFSQC